jgi:tRNA pseudouridine55 synthase
MTSLEDKIFVINKEEGPTSFDVVEAFKTASGVRKVGHAGTLDPLAGGVLLLCSGKATRVVEHLMDLQKTYEFEVKLGRETTTLDGEGEVLREVPCPDIADGDIVAAANSFTGEYQLEPPAFSALKKDGKRFYTMARAGERPKAGKRLVKIYRIEVLRIDLPSVHLRMTCSRGTYVRSLARDFGARLDIPAHVGRLVRTDIGSFNIEDAFPSRRLFENDLSGLSGLELRDAMAFLPGIVVRESAKRGLLHGIRPETPDVVEAIGDVKGESAIRILDETGRLLAVGKKKRIPGEVNPSLVDSFRLLVNEV